MSEPELVEIGRRIFDRRVDREYTQRDLGSVLGIGQGTVSLIESGRVSLDRMRLPEIAYHLGVTEAWLMTGAS